MTAKGSTQKKNYGIIWEFFPNVGPLPPLAPFGNFEHYLLFFWSSWKFLGDFWVILRCVKGGFRAMVITQKFWEMG